MSYLCDPFSIFCLIFIVINHITSFKQAYLIFLHFLEYLLLFLDDNMDKESKYFQIAKVAYKSAAYKTSVYMGKSSLLFLLRQAPLL